MADISPIPTLLPRVAEYEPVNVIFSPILGSDESLVSLSITQWEDNDGIIINTSSFDGEYTNTFDYGKDRLLYRRGDEFSYLDTWDDIPNPNSTDIYYWRAPRQPRIYIYVVTLVYTVKTTGEEGGSTTTSHTLTKTYTHNVFPNWDVYAKKLKEQIKIRSETWLE